jgi:hypothetical protein
MSVAIGGAQGKSGFRKPGPPVPHPRQGLDRNPSQACATKMLMLTMPKNAVTISIITTVLYAPHGRNGMAGRTVKRNQSGASASRYN